MIMKEAESSQSLYVCCNIPVAAAEFNINSDVYLLVFP